MQLIQINPTTWESDDALVRIEASPVRRVEVASEELLDDAVTAKHYFAGKRDEKQRNAKTGKEEVVEKTGIDALGKPIEIGKPMHFIDWRSRRRVFQVYRKTWVPKTTYKADPESGEVTEVEEGRFRYLPVGEPLDKDFHAFAHAADVYAEAKTGESPKDMAAYLHDDVLDGALNILANNADQIYICSQEPANHTEATSTYDLGVKDHGAAGSAVGAPQNGDTSGRKVATVAVTDGTVGTTGTASHWAIVDSANSKLLAANSLSSSQSVTSGNNFSLPSFDIEFPDPS